MAYALMHRPYSRELVRAQYDVINEIGGVVEVELDEITRHTVEGFLDLLSERLIGNGLLQDIGYKVVGHDGNWLHLDVSGDPSAAIELWDK